MISSKRLVAGMENAGGDKSGSFASVDMSSSGVFRASFKNTDGIATRGRLVMLREKDGQTVDKWSYWLSSHEVESSDSSKPAGRRRLTVSHLSTAFRTRPGRMAEYR